jgi:hypothetical protein
LSILVLFLALDPLFFAVQIVFFIKEELSNKNEIQKIEKNFSTKKKINAFFSNQP